MIKLKIGRGIYQITDKSLFMGNAACVQLRVNSCDRYGNYEWVVLSKRAVKEIEEFERVAIDGIRFTLRGV